MCRTRKALKNKDPKTTFQRFSQPVVKCAPKQLRREKNSPAKRKTVNYTKATREISSQLPIRTKVMPLVPSCERLRLGALISHGVRAFVLTAQDITAQEMAAIFLRARRKIEKFLGSNNGPFMVAVARSGALRVVWPEQGNKK